jgi:hypothetical protein
MDDGRFGAVTQELRDLGSGAGGALEMRVRSVLVLGPPSPAQALVLVSDSNKRARIDIPPDARAVMLEEWSLSLDRATTLDQAQHGEDPYPGVYKQAIALMRSLYALLRYVPAWQLHRKLGPGSGMKVVVVAALVGREEDTEDEDVLGFSEYSDFFISYPWIYLLRSTQAGARRTRSKHLCISSDCNATGRDLITCAIPAKCAV